MGCRFFRYGDTVAILVDSRQCLECVRILFHCNQYKQNSLTLVYAAIIIAMMMPQKGDLIVKGKSGLCSFASKLLPPEASSRDEQSVEIFYEHLHLSSWK